MLDYLKSKLWSATKRAPTPVSLLFLDIDGVLNSQETRETGDHMPAQELLDNLADIVLATGTAQS